MLEPLVAESVVLSASGEPVRPERKATQSPTSPRSHPSDEDGKRLPRYSTFISFGSFLVEEEFFSKFISTLLICFCLLFILLVSNSFVGYLWGLM